MRSRVLMSFAAAAVLAGVAADLAAESDFPALDIPELLAASKDYRHKADVLRRMIGARERKIGAIQQQSNALLAQAQAEAQARAAAAQANNSNNQLKGSLLGGFGGLFFGGCLL